MSKMMVGKVFTVVLCCLLWGCYPIKKTNALMESGKVPKSSKWLGGKDGGVWVNITIDSEHDFYIDTYNDYTGEKINHFNYKFNCSNIDQEIIFKGLVGSSGLELLWSQEKSIVNCIELIENK